MYFSTALYLIFYNLIIIFYNLQKSLALMSNILNLVIAQLYKFNCVLKETFRHTFHFRSYLLIKGFLFVYSTRQHLPLIKFLTNKILPIFIARKYIPGHHND